MTTTVDACAHAEQRMQGYLDRLLSADEVTAVETHLAACTECACAYRFEVRLREHVKSCVGREDEDRCCEELMAKLKSFCCDEHNA